MRADEYAALDALGVSTAIRVGDVTADEVADAAYDAIAALNPALGAVVEVIERDHPAVADLPVDGPLHGTPFLVKDLGPHFAGLRYEWASRLCEGLTAEADSHFGQLVRASGVRIVGRSATPEFSMATCGDSMLHGPCRNPWDPSRSTNGSSGGAAAAVAAGLVPIAHASDIGGSTRGPAAWCGTVGLHPSRGRVSGGPEQSESGLGMAQSSCVTRTVRDTAAFLDRVGVHVPGDPFRIPGPPLGSFAAHAEGSRARYRIGWSADPLMHGAPVDRETAEAVEMTANALAELGHEVVEGAPAIDLEALNQVALELWFFRFNTWLDELGAMTGRTPGPDTLERATWSFYLRAAEVPPDRFFAALDELNRATRRMAPYFTEHDVWLSPVNAQVAQPRGVFSMDVDLPPLDFLRHEQAVAQFMFPYNAAGLPAISLPLALHSSGVPIGVQVGGGPAMEHVLLELAAELEQALPWRDRRPSLHVAA